jgi:hypothetical protein
MLRLSNGDAKPATDYPFCFQRNSPSMIGSVETVVVSFEFSPTLSPSRWLGDDSAMCADIFLQINAARRELDEPHVPLAT